MHIRHIYVIFILLIAMQFSSANTVENNNDSDYRIILSGRRIQPKCGPGERADEDGICRYVWK